VVAGRFDLHNAAHSAQTMPAYRAAALQLARQFIGTDLEVIAYGCTAAGFISGRQATHSWSPTCGS
jgi:maleate cis-trans isomerase